MNGSGEYIGGVMRQTTGAIERDGCGVKDGEEDDVIEDEDEGWTRGKRWNAMKGLEVSVVRPAERSSRVIESTFALVRRSSE